MNRRILTTSKGLTLVELLATLAIFSLISVIIIGYLISAMNNFTRVNEEIALHDEANYVMSEFINYIFVATNVVEKEQSGCKSLIEVTNFEGKVTKLGFENNQAVIITIDPVTKEEKKRQLSTYTFSCAGSEDSKITVSDTVNIKMFIQDEESKYKKKIELNSEVSFVKVD